MVTTLGSKLERTGGSIEVTKETLVDFLRDNEIGTSAWGTGRAKTIDDLLEELREGESELVVCEEGLRRVTPIDQIEIRYVNPDGKEYRLVEQRQVFWDGNRERVRSLPRSLGEKIKAGEDPKITAVRGIKEELGIEVTQDRVIDFGIEYEEMESPSYPGLVTRYDKHNFLIKLTDDEYDPIGYTEDDGKKVTTFVWQEVKE